MTLPTAPFVGMLPADAARVGGLYSTRRHGFGIFQGGAPVQLARVPVPAPPPTPAPAPTPKFIEIEAPPKRQLAQGPMQVPELSQAQVADLQADIDAVADVLQVEMEAVKVEADAVSGPAVRAEPELYRSIAVIGPLFSPQQIRSVLLADARALESAAKRLLTGSAKSYVSDAARATLETVISDAQALIEYVRQFDLETPTGDAAQLAQDHVESHVKAAKGMTAALEKKIVGAEAKSVPVEEGLQTGSFLGALAAVGALVLVGFLISEYA